MKRIRGVLLAFFLLAAADVHSAVTVPAVVKVLPGTNINLIASLLGGAIIDSLPGANTYLLRLPSLPVVTPLLHSLGLDWVELDKGVSLPSNPPLSSLSVPLGIGADWYKQQPALQMIHAEAALQYSTGQGMLVADINSSVAAAHPALVGHIGPGHDFVSGRPPEAASLNDDQSTAGFLDDDQSTAGFLDDDQSTAGFLDGSGISLFDDQSTAGFLDGGAASHGTFCAGIIAVVAPGATIMPLRAFDDHGHSDLFTLAKAIRYARQNSAHVLNMSFGTLNDARVLHEAVDYALAGGMILVASAGNNNTSVPQYPAAYSGVIAVAATDLVDRKTSFSNFGSYVFVDAPGEHIVSATPNGYAIANGTSFSAPMVAAEAALIRSIQYNSVAATIATSTVNINAQNPGYAGALGSGRVNLADAVSP